jgi:hypothetical protein
MLPMKVYKMIGIPMNERMTSRAKKQTDHTFSASDKSPDIALSFLNSQPGAVSKAPTEEWRATSPA